jgi:hypothetical protein
MIISNTTKMVVIENQTDIENEILAEYDANAWK